MVGLICSKCIDFMALSKSVCDVKENFFSKAGQASFQNMKSQMGIAGCLGLCLDPCGNTQGQTGSLFVKSL